MQIAGARWRSAFRAEIMQIPSASLRLGQKLQPRLRAQGLRVEAADLG